MRRSLRILLGLDLMLLGGLLVWGLWEWTSPRSTHPVELTPQERARVFGNFQMTPQSFLIHVVPRAEFEARLLRTGYEASMIKEVGAFALTYGKLCTIYLPEGFGIEYMARGAGNNARWRRVDDGDTVAHEILHCYKGSWHD